MLEAETIQRMEWPVCSPDLNPIEHVWYMLVRRIAARPRPPATVRDLEIALLEEWNSIPQSLIDNLIASMANRLPVNERDNQNAKQGAESSQPEVPLSLRRAKSISTFINKYTSVTQITQTPGKSWEALAILGPIPRHLKRAEIVAR
ncbi:acyl-CoA synthetase family member 2, mitochondrial [Trichonephila clavipes]|nr:acyl-CoA synthetase family member 2, mitochondrial [Trichonephila clavipes]